MNIHLLSRLPLITSMKLSLVLASGCGGKDKQGGSGLNQGRLQENRT